MNRKYRRIWPRIVNVINNTPWYVWLLVAAANFGIIKVLPSNSLGLSLAMFLLLLGVLSAICGITLLVNQIIKKQLHKSPGNALIFFCILVISGLALWLASVINHSIQWQKSINLRLLQVEQRFGKDFKLGCNPSELPEKLQPSIVRVIGNNSEGTGFFIDQNRIITNFHVIDKEPSPKIVFNDNSFEKPVSIIGDKSLDLAILTVNTTREPLKSMVASGNVVFGEPVYSVGYPRGSDFPGPPLLSMGSFAGTREAQTSSTPELVITNASLIQGMSGGPLVDACGNAVAINTMGEPGISFYINLAQALIYAQNFSSNDVTELKVDPITPDGAVKGFYDLINASRWQEAFDLISPQRRQGYTLDTWLVGYKNTLHVDVIKSTYSNGKVVVKLYARDWVNGQIQSKYFEGYWAVEFAGDVWNLTTSEIKEIPEPSGYVWWYE